MAFRKKKKVLSQGKRVGTKRSDKRWEAPNGEIWDSRFEYVVYTKFKEAGLRIERCDKRDTFSFVLPIRGGICSDCESTEVGQQRHYTPDFRIIPKGGSSDTPAYYIETKGYLRSKDRSLLRSFRKAHPDSSVRFIFQSNYRATKPSKSGDGSVMTWFAKYMKLPAVVWNGSIPRGW